MIEQIPSEPMQTYFSGNVSSVWDDEGCRVSRTGNDTVTCACDHFTNFALLLNVAGRELDEDKVKILSYISDIGCGISLVGLVLTIVAHSAVRYIFFLLEVIW